MLLRLLAPILLVAALVLPPRTSETRFASSADPYAHTPLARMVGQQVMERMSGTSADPALLARIKAGHVGGVILYSDDISSPSQTGALVHQLQSAARAGHNPPLLISTDQEGGQVKRLPWAAPTIPPPQMGADGSSVSRSQGLQTGRDLKAVGINVDLAPVVDVAHSSGAFIWQQGRSFGMTSQRVINSAVPFALGMLKGGVAPTAKHFPGVGGATVDTDFAKQTISVGARDLAPYKVLIPDHVPLIMVSTGVYPSLDSSRAPAALSRKIVMGLLRRKLRFTGVTISDDLERPTGYSTQAAVVRAAQAGIDEILVSSTEGSGPLAYRTLIAAARAGKVSRAQVEAAYGRILALKARYG